MNGRYKSIAPLEIALWYFRGIPNGAIWTIVLYEILSKSSPIPCPSPSPCPCPCIVSFHFCIHVRSVSMSVSVSMFISVLFQFKYGATNIYGRHGNYIVDFQGFYQAEVGKRNFFLSPQSQFRNLKEAPPQSQFRNLWRNVIPQLQLRNSAIAIFSEVRNFKSATWELQFRNFRHIFGRGNRSIHGEKIRGQKSCATVPLRQVFGFQRKEDS